jgi:Undecaprenyl-phosphate galactose phosphotransferase WbaP
MAFTEVSSEVKDTVLEQQTRGSTHGVLGSSSNAVENIEPPSATRLPGTRGGWPMRLTYLAGDAIAIVAAIVVAAIGSNFVRGVAWNALPVVEFKLFAILALGLIAVAALVRTYAAIPPRPVRQFRGWVLGSSAVCGSEIAIVCLLGVAPPSTYFMLAMATGWAVVLASFSRAVCRMRFGSAPWWGTRIIVVGSDCLTSDLLANLQREPQWGLRPVGYVRESAPYDDANAPAGCLGSINELNEIAAEVRVDRALITAASFDSEELAELLAHARGQIQHWIFLPSLELFPSMWLEECEAARLPALAVTSRLASPSACKLKRGFDIAVTLGVGLLSLPLLVGIAALVRLTSAGPVFYGQERIGYRGRRFKAWKFRTMVNGAEAVLAKCLEDHPELAPEWDASHKLKRDPRVTWVGRWIRSISLDELPQIWNVLVGDMSLVGPRPIVANEIEKYADRYDYYVQVLPGITGLWQVSGRNNTTYAERVDLDAYYVLNWSIWLDLYILAATVKVVVLGEGAY